MDKRSAAFLFAGLLALPGWAADSKTPAPKVPDRAAPEAKAPAPQAPAPKTPAKAKPATAARLPPDDLTAPGIRHVVVCPPPKIASCVMRRPVSGGYRVLTSGVEVADNGPNWLVDFGRGPKEPLFLLQVVDSGGSLHDIEVSFRAKPGMRKTPTLPEE